ncbi:Transposase and inactivated derivatives, IS30 family [Suttonella indologenes]|uniref:Transposase and inactivated derivatives, IS30 family n=1 Tax=Suttonella indologenes TaxID=13276 RepID=A0A380MWS8_9GAMM|nr:Transposase and inactivated derivatives, IS30 family [Suttonella indologenes]
MNAYYRHLTLSERESIMILLAQGKKQSEIARQLGRSCSTISRELKRHVLKVYRASSAHSGYQASEKVQSDTQFKTGGISSFGAKQGVGRQVVARTAQQALRI